MPAYNELIKLSIELEGALRVAQARQSIEAIDLAKEKLAVISYLLSRLTVETAHVAPAAAAIETPKPKPAPALVVETPDEDEPCIDADDEVDDAEAASDAPRAASNPAEILKAFTLNDKFLFRRELFGNDAEAFNDSLALIASMSTFHEVEEYVYYDLCFDRDSEEVAEFMNILSNYFANR